MISGKVDTKGFREGAFIGLEDIQLQSALHNINHFTIARDAALAEIPDAAGLRDRFKQARDATMSRLADYLEQFEENATRAGAVVHWASDGEEACRIVLKIAQSRGVKLAVKSKSMVTEEVHLNAALAKAGIMPVETDLGEYIIQLAEEPPSHIIAPAIHKTKAQVVKLLESAAGKKLDDSIEALTAEARKLLREKFLSAGMGISGGNILVAETGSLVLVTNEGNGRMVTSVPPLHVALVGIEKVAPDWDVAAMWLSLLARSATGQPMSVYTSILTGPARHNDIDGPEEVHIVLLDNGRSRLVGTKYEEVLHCIRCGACLNVCPVYRGTGGHAYGNPYSGPIGAVLAPLLFGREKFSGLPQASTLCGACLDVCPARIDLPRMLLEHRNDQVQAGQTPGIQAMAERVAAFGLSSHRLMQIGTGLGRMAPASMMQRLMPDTMFLGRTPPALARKSFRKLWAEGEVDDLGT